MIVGFFLDFVKQQRKGTRRKIELIRYTVIIYY